MKDLSKLTAILLTSVALAGATAASATDTNIWSTTFEDPVHPYYEQVGPWPNVDMPNLMLLGPTLASVPAGSPFTGFGDTYLHGSGLDLATFLQSGIGLGTGALPTTLHLQFDLAYIDGWDSIGGNPATDGFAFSFDGTPILWNAGNSFGVTANGPETVLATGNDLFGDPELADTVVHYDFIFSHNQPSILLGFQTTGLPFGPLANNPASWGIDNFSLGAVTGETGGGTPGGVSGVPEAPTWAMLLAGFGLVGALTRRKRVVTSFT